MICSVFLWPHFLFIGLPVSATLVFINKKKKKRTSLWLFTVNTFKKNPKKPKESVHLLPTAYSNEKITTGKQPKHKRLSNEEVFDLETQATLCFFSIFLWLNKFQIFVLYSPVCWWHLLRAQVNWFVLSQTNSKTYYNMYSALAPFNFQFYCWTLLWCFH